MTCLVKVLSLLHLFTSLTYALPHALGVRAWDQKDPLTPVEFFGSGGERSYVVAFEEGTSYHAGFLDQVKSTTGVTARLETDLTGKIFNGVSIRVEDHDESLDVATKIADLPGIVGVYPNDPITTPELNITSVTGSGNHGRMNTTSRLAAAADYFTNDQIMTQVDALRARGFTGKEIKVAVIDGEADTSHPALRISFGKNYQEPDDIGNPEPSCKSHATAVAGLVSSLPGPDGFRGVAPDVTLGNYIISGCKHGGHVGLILQAMEQAVTDNVNILSVSLVWGNNWKFLDETRVFEKVAALGVLLVYGAGNGGGDGLWRTPESCAAPGVLCVGMIENTRKPVWENISAYSVDGSSGGDLRWRPANLGTGWAGVNLPVWTNLAPDAGGWNGHGGSGCAELPADIPDLSQYIVLMRRNLCNEDDMIERVAAKGAKYILIGELNEDFVDLFDPDIRIPHPTVTALATVTGKQAVDLVKLLREGRRLVVNMGSPTFLLNNRPNLVDGQPAGGKIQPGSQWGPTFDGAMSVDVAAPGSDIPILAPVGQGKYGIAGGTSLATPIVAGVAALVAEALDTTDPKTIANVLISTAKPLDRDVGGGWGPGLASIAHQGGGMVQADRAALASAVLSAGCLEFNDTNYRTQKSFTITNLRTHEITFDISNVPAGTLYSFATGDYPSPIGGFDTIREKQYVQNAASLSFSPSTSIRVPANGQATVEVTAMDPAGLDLARLPIWSGFVALSGSDGSNLTLPYLGFAGDIDRVPKVLQAKRNAPAVTFPDEEMVFEIHHGMGTRAFELFIHDAETNERVHPGSLLGREKRATVAYAFGWRGEIQGFQVPAGQYKLRTQALRAFGQIGSTDETDYLYLDSEPFTVSWSK